MVAPFRMISREIDTNDFNLVRRKMEANCIAAGELQFDLVGGHLWFSSRLTANLT